ncbi:hypothetical protein PtB15_5B186 [Puccinia triticina]|nr:hypothetical protein PtB15_5B186 [Puccinia triticina]
MPHYDLTTLFRLCLVVWGSCQAAEGPAWYEFESVNTQGLMGHQAPSFDALLQSIPTPILRDYDKARVSTAVQPTYPNSKESPATNPVGRNFRGFGWPATSDGGVSIPSNPASQTSSGPYDLFPTNAHRTHPITAVQFETSQSPRIPTGDNGITLRAQTQEEPADNNLSSNVGIEIAPFLRATDAGPRNQCSSPEIADNTRVLYPGPDDMAQLSKRVKIEHPASSTDTDTQSSSIQKLSNTPFITFKNHGSHEIDFGLMVHSPMRRGKRTSIPSGSGPSNYQHQIPCFRQQDMMFHGRPAFKIATSVTLEPVKNPVNNPSDILRKPT